MRAQEVDAGFVIFKTSLKNLTNNTGTCNTQGSHTESEFENDARGNDNARHDVIDGDWLKESWPPCDFLLHTHNDCFLKKKKKYIYIYI